MGSASAEAYVEAHVRHDLKEAGYVTAEVLGCDEKPNCTITRKRAGGRVNLGFQHGQCMLLHWRCGADTVHVPMPLT
jgi:hypothetical protein